MMKLYLKKENEEEILHLPFAAEELQCFFQSEEKYSDVITQCEIEAVEFDLNLNCKIDKMDNLHELNYLACLLELLDRDGRQKLQAIYSCQEEKYNSVAMLINLIFNLDCYELWEEAVTEEEWAKKWLLNEGETEGYNLDEDTLNWLEDYLDLARIWRNESGQGEFTDYGYLEEKRWQYQTVYHEVANRIATAIDVTALVQSRIVELKAEIKSPYYPKINPETAAHVLYGFKLAFKELGLLCEKECYVSSEEFNLV